MGTPTVVFSMAGCGTIPHRQLPDQCSAKRDMGRFRRLAWSPTVACMSVGLLGLLGCGTSSAPAPRIQSANEGGESRVVTSVAPVRPAVSPPAASKDPPAKAREAAPQAPSGDRAITASLAGSEGLPLPSTGPLAPRPFLNGDIIFHEAKSEQSELVRIVTRSNWTHLGVIWNSGDGPVVYEAAAPVKATPLEAWVKRGKGEHYVVKRLIREDGVAAALDDGATAKMRALLERWIGLPYDYRFRWDDQQMYCSEFVYKLFERGAGTPVGKLERASDMALDDPVVQLVIKSRWGKSAYKPNEPVVTPDSIFRDPRLIEVEP